MAFEDFEEDDELQEREQKELAKLEEEEKKAKTKKKKPKKKKATGPKPAPKPTEVKDSTGRADTVNVTEVEWAWEEPIKNLQESVAELKDHEKQLQQMMRSVMQRAEKLENRAETSTVATRTLRQFVESNKVDINEYAECIHTLEQRITSIEGLALLEVTEDTTIIPNHGIVMTNQNDINEILKLEEEFIDLIELVRIRRMDRIKEYDEKHGTSIKTTAGATAELTKLSRKIFNMIRELK